MEDDNLEAPVMLQNAKRRIRELERQLTTKENELRRYRFQIRSLRRGDRSGRHYRERRMARGDLFRQRSVMTDQEEEDASTMFPPRPLGCFAMLQVTALHHENLPPSTPHTPLSASDDPPPPASERQLPLPVQRLKNIRFRVGPEGAVIGFGRDCGIRLPKESGISNHHIRIEWCPADPCCQLVSDVEPHGISIVVPSDDAQSNESCSSFLWDKGYFKLIDISGDTKVFTASGDVLSHLELESDSATTPPPYSYQLECLGRFITMSLEWTIKPLPICHYISAKMFAAVKNGDVDFLEKVVAEAEKYGVCVGGSSKNYSRTPSLGPGNPIDFNAEEDLSSDEETIEPMNSYVYAGLCRIPSRSIMSGERDKRSLLHLAIECRKIDVVRFLLKKGAQVNMQSGTAERSALHLAVEQDDSELVNELLSFGADLDILDSNLNPSLAYAQSYAVRKLLLSAMMLCAVSEGGDLAEVKRLVEVERVSPNAIGLKHKAALHLASARGHADIVKYLITQKADVNLTGGSRRRTPLHYASVHNRVEVARLLTAPGVEANEELVDADGNTALNLSMGGDMCRLLHKKPLSLCLAAQSGDYSEALRIVEKWSDTNNESAGKENMIDQRNEQNHSALHLASAAGHEQLVRLLVSHGAMINLLGGVDEWTPLFFSALAGHVGVTAFLLSVGANAEIVDKAGMTVQDHIRTILEESRRKLKTLKAKRRPSGTEEGQSTHSSLKVPVSLQRQESDYSLDSQLNWLKRRKSCLKAILDIVHSSAQKMLQAINRRSAKDMRELLETGNINVNCSLEKDSSSTALFYAARKDLTDVVEVLLQFKADPNIAGQDGLYPFHVAAQHGCVDILQLLVDAGVDVNIRTQFDKRTPLYVAAACGQTDSIIFLLKHNATPLLPALNGSTPFDITEKLAIKKLLASGDQRLLIAAYEGDATEVKRLIEIEGISVMTTFHEGLTALHVACKEDKLDVAKLLIDKGADVNQQDGSRMFTPLHWASRLRTPSVAEYLLSHGAQVGVKDSTGKTPFEIANSNSMRKLLVQSRSIHVRKLSVDTVPDEAEDIRRCRICMSNDINTIVLPCGHQAFCSDCACKIQVCALDRQPIHEIVTVYAS
ncbi:poly [ADP-ribose] polymerase tankyrase-1-like isoform X2 [Corticium candelabrum]|uniref:poly [ADP-ribose] polymerase tankyrase-1-like isoform X2 n=1 Tax=Corticium candelabrum TaxID=121492 RepID=UPI002E25C84D|nr:poly [ADP-ribose] polymerase tankyrase-1-like isoform X2 [Corticium candelabrum]